MPAAETVLAVPPSPDATDDVEEEEEDDEDDEELLPALPPDVLVELGVMGRCRAAPGDSGGSCLTVEYCWICAG